MTPSPNRTNVELPHHDEEPEGIDGGFGACFEDNDYTFQDDASQQNLSIDGEESAQNDPHRGEKMTNFVGDVVTTTQNPELTGHSVSTGLEACIYNTNHDCFQTQNSLSLLGTPKAIEGLGEAETQSQNLPNGTTMPEESIDLGSFAINHSSIYDTDASTSLDPNFNSALDDWNENDLNPEEGWKNFFNSSPGPTSVADEAFKNIENNGFGSQNNFVQPDSNGRVNQNVQQEQTSGQFADFLPNDDFLDNRNQHTGSTQNGHGFYPGLGSTYSLENETNDARGGEPFQRNGCPQYTSGRQAQSSNAADFGDFGEYSRSIIAPTFNNCGQQIPLNPRQNLYSQSSCRDSEPPIYACPQHFTPHGVDSNKNSTNLMHGGRPQMPRGSRPPPPMIGPQPNPTQTGPVPAPAPSRTLIQPDYRVKDYIWSEPPQGKSPNKAKAEDEKWNAYPRGPREILSSPFPEYFGDPEDPDSFLPQKIPWKMLSPLQLVEWKGSSGHVRDLVEQEIMPRLEDYPGKNENDTPAEKKVKESKICRRISMREQRQRLGRQLMGDAKYQKKGKGKNDLETPEVILKFFKNLTTAQLLHVSFGSPFERVVLTFNRVLGAIST
jgi:hypothetical protein